MKKTLLTLLLMSLLILPLSALPQTQKIRIVAVNFPAYDFSRVVAGDLAEVSMLLPPGMESHSYEPSPRDLVALQRADLLVYTGGIGDLWVDSVLEALGQDAPASLKMMAVVDTVAEELVEGMEDAPHAHAHEDDEHEHDDDHEDDRELDEHVWTDPRNADLISEAIAKKLVELDPEDQADYMAHYQAYHVQLQQLDQAFQDLVSTAKRKVIVLADRFPMRYFTRAYGLEYYAAFPGCAAQTEANPRTLAFLMNKVEEEKIPVIFSIEFSSGRSASVISEQTGARMLTLHSAHNVSQQDLDLGISYLSIMEENLKVLQEALN